MNGVYGSEKDKTINCVKNHRRVILFVKEGNNTTPELELSHRKGRVGLILLTVYFERRLPSCRPRRV